MKKKFISFTILGCIILLFFFWSLISHQFEISIDASNISEKVIFEIGIKKRSTNFPKLPILIYDIKIETNLKNPTFEYDNQTLIFNISYTKLEKVNNAFIFKDVNFHLPKVFLYLLGESVKKNEIKVFIIARFLIFEVRVTKSEKIVGEI